jgi:hypothetical protein
MCPHEVLSSSRICPKCMVTWRHVCPHGSSHGRMCRHRVMGDSMRVGRRAEPSTLESQTLSVSLLPAWYGCYGNPHTRSTGTNTRLHMVLPLHGDGNPLSEENPRCLRTYCVHGNQCDSQMVELHYPYPDASPDWTFPIACARRMSQTQKSVNFPYPDAPPPGQATILTGC